MTPLALMNEQQWKSQRNNETVEGHPSNYYIDFVEWYCLLHISNTFQIFALMAYERANGVHVLSPEEIFASCHIH